MTVFKNIIGRICALWAIIAFFITMLFILIPVWIVSSYPEPKRTISVFNIFRIWMKVFFVSVGVRRIFKGEQHFKTSENFIVICNHSSFLDVALASPGIPGPNKTIAKIEMSRLPLFGMIYKSGSVLVDRKNEQSRQRRYGKMKEVLAMGLHMCIYPEGTRNKTKEPLQRFHDGAFRLAVDTEKQIVPAVIFHTNRVMPRNKTFYFWPHNIEMHFLHPIPSAGKTIEALREESFEVMKQHILQYRKKNKKISRY
ncbi:MAG TPA: lysophospholipid acyltransferase family protein [Chitinophagaceae bacterium]|nr:lysophospholipid acyltransferase family protein [Chitinophagaceae bacterium]